MNDISLLVFPFLAPSGGHASTRAETERHVREVPGKRKDQESENHCGFLVDGQAKPAPRGFHSPSSKLCLHFRDVDAK